MGYHQALQAEHLPNEGQVLSCLFGGQGFDVSPQCSQPMDDYETLLVETTVIKSSKTDSIRLIAVYQALHQCTGL
jgi:hypothetical protein